MQTETAVYAPTEKRFQAPFSPLSCPVTSGTNCPQISRVAREPTVATNKSNCSGGVQESSSEPSRGRVNVCILDRGARNVSTRNFARSGKREALERRGFAVFYAQWAICDFFFIPRTVSIGVEVRESEPNWKIFSKHRRVYHPTRRLNAFPPDALF